MRSNFPRETSIAKHLALGSIPRYLRQFVIKTRKTNKTETHRIKFLLNHVLKIPICYFLLLFEDQRFKKGTAREKGAIETVPMHTSSYHFIDLIPVLEMNDKNRLRTLNWNYKLEIMTNQVTP